MLVQKAISSGVYFRGETYCFRWTVPPEFRPYLGIRELKRSLHTSDKRLAMARSHGLFELVEQLTRLRYEYQSGTASEADFVSGIQEVRTAISNNQQFKVKPPKLFHRALKDFIQFKISEGLTGRMEQEYRRNVNAICAMTENIPVKCIDSAYLRDMLVMYAKLPKRNINPYQGLAVEELLKMSIPEKDRVSPKTVSHILKFLQGFFVYARQNGLATESPAKNLNLKLDLSSRYGVFNDKDVKKILNYVDSWKNWKKWTIYLAIYTGARRGEITQLRKQDIKQDEETGIHYIQITPEAGSVKTSNSVRKVPLHSELIKAGFLKFVLDSNERLFIETTPVAVSRFFKLVLKHCDIEGIDVDGNPTVYHSVRHTFITKARGAHNNTVAIQQIVGHESTKAGITDRYTHRLNLGVLSDVVETVVFLN